MKWTPKKLSKVGMMMQIIKFMRNYINPIRKENCCGNGLQYIGFNYYTNFSQKCLFLWFFGWDVHNCFLFFLIIITLHSCVSWTHMSLVDFPLSSLIYVKKKSLGAPFYCFVKKEMRKVKDVVWWKQWDELNMHKKTISQALLYP